MPVGDDTFAYKRYLPHLQKRGKTYFVTFSTRDRRVLSDSSRDLVLSCCIRDHRTAYWLHCACVMPDHVHLIFTPFDGYTLARSMNRIKGSSSHAINAMLNHNGHVWQREYFDRAVRSHEDLRKNSEYICANPVRAGLVDRVEDYGWIWRQWIDEAPPRAAALH